ncbi:hypothetical protein HNV11_17675 [Spirosoma taeanense]|uniref:Uncharacterized protein n=1 Tax=Spirosoma taeanense TaxID=2735870 RepID=A0A6M5YC07_9BACT|nr:hypothetical protein [Spirosoma taeanense]QJW91074.1 hypothetical protein HNV11_17675 [Spirosoma taeanense]
MTPMPTQTKTMLVDDCVVSRTDAPVNLSIQILFGQLADILVRIDGETVVQYSNDDTNPPTSILLGSNNSLADKTMRISVLVKDTNGNTDDSGVNVTLTGMPSLVNHLLLSKISPSGSTKFFSFEFNFFQMEP